MPREGERVKGRRPWRKRAIVEGQDRRLRQGQEKALGAVKDMPSDQGAVLMSTGYGMSGLWMRSAPYLVQRLGRMYRPG